MGDLMNVSKRHDPEGSSILKKQSFKIAQNPQKKSRKLKSRTKADVASNTNVLASNVRKTKERSQKDTKESGSRWDVAINKAKHNITWEQAVSKARGCPDGSNDGQHQKNEITNKFIEDTKHLKKEREPFKKKMIKLVGGKINSEDKKRGMKRKASDENDSGTTSPAKTAKVELSKKERKKQRQMLRNNYELIKKCKALWEELRRHSNDKNNTDRLCKELSMLVKGRCKELIYAHDSARIIQSLYKLGSAEIRNDIFSELKGDIVEICKSKYGCFIIKKLLKYGTKSQRSHIFKSLYGNVRKLVRHSIASSVLEYAYNEYANAQQRAALMEEFYGPSFALFKTPEVKTIDQVLKSDSGKRETILRNMKNALLPLTDKSVVLHSIVHRAFFEFFLHADVKKRNEMIECLRESCVHMLHTREGSRVTMYCIWHGTTKDRKVIMKSFKSHVVKICHDEYGHMALLALFDCVDDTKLLQKVILDEMLKSLEEVAFNSYGIKVLLYLLKARDPLHFHPDVVNILQQGDNNLTSKKDSTVRMEELLLCVSAPLLRFIKSHTKKLVIGNSTLLLILSILTHAKGDASDAMEAISKVAAEPFVSGSLDTIHIVEHPAGHLTLKKLIINDKERMVHGNPVLFSTVLVNTVPEGSLKSWAACNRGCFILNGLLELNVPTVSEKIHTELLPIMDSLASMSFKGAQILSSKLAIV